MLSRRGLSAFQHNLQRRAFASSSEEYTVETHPFKLHRVEESEGPSTSAKTSNEELEGLFTTMTRMRRMELAADMMYKQKLARGFLHLADGQEALAAGTEAALTFKDSIIQSYRDHCSYLGRGGTVKEVFAELLGKKDGAARGLGGSMHLYKKEHNFFGGAGIVGAQIPLGTGLAFKHHYRKDNSVAVAFYGDGSANQGQVAEAYNMAALWSLPMIFAIENNHVGMGTSVERAAKSNEFYTRGDYLPGLWIDGMDVLAVRQGMAWAKKFVLEQKSPLVVELDTFRYHGHSISDPGTTYRTRDDIQKVRRARDPIDRVRKLLLEHGWGDAKQLKALEKSIKKEVDEALEEAKKSEFPPIEDLWNNIYVDGLHAQMRPIEIGLPKIQLPGVS